MTTFDLAESHLKLLKRAYVAWDDGEYGAPAIDCKRPYGNSSVADDICDILNWPYDSEDGPTHAQRDAADAIHRETRTALQIILCCMGSAIVPGAYAMTKQYDTRSWQLIAPALPLRALPPKETPA